MATTFDTDPPRSRRERLREAALHEIKDIARRQMAEYGAASLSLRAIAREMGVSSAALFRYYRSRDDLVTALIVDAYANLADAMEAAGKSQPADDLGGRYLAVVMAYRAWALAHPTEFMLIFGTPIPGYHAPESTTEVARRALAPFVVIMLDAVASGWTASPPYDALPSSLAEELQARPLGASGLPPAAIYLILASWALGQGLITLELFGDSPPLVGDNAAFYRTEALLMLQRMNLLPKHSSPDDPLSPAAQRKD